MAVRRSVDSGPLAIKNVRIDESYVRHSGLQHDGGWQDWSSQNANLETSLTDWRWR